MGWWKGGRVEKWVSEGVREWVSEGVREWVSWFLSQRRRGVFNWGLCTQTPKALHLLHFYTAILNLLNLLTPLNLLNLLRVFIEAAIKYRDFQPQRSQRTQRLCELCVLCGSTYFIAEAIGGGLQDRRCGFDPRPDLHIRMWFNGRTPHC